MEAAAIIPLPPEASDERTRIQNECFYLPLLVLVALLIPTFRERCRMWKRGQSLRYPHKTCP